MTKKATTLRLSTTFVPCVSLNLRRRLCESAAICRLSEIYSDLLEEKITPDRTLRLIHAQIAVFALLTCCNSSLLVLCALTAWAFGSIYAARR